MGITFSSAMLGTMLGFVEDLFTDIKLPILVLTGLMIGFFILEGVMLGLFRRKQEQEREEDDED